MTIVIKWTRYCRDAVIFPLTNEKHVGGILISESSSLPRVQVGN